ncbi:MAG: hypothetical protein WAV15_03480 [Minisyncoccia bacterium]
MTVDELRKSDPDMFQHPELKPNEVRIGFVGPEIIDNHLEWWHQHGVPSARQSEGTTPIEFEVGSDRGKQKGMIPVPAILGDAAEYCKTIREK